MIRPIEPTNFLQQSTRFCVIDVRSPGEYTQGHIPGAINIPLFDDAERTIVGTFYVQSGREYAILKGLDIALPKTDRFIQSLRVVQTRGKVLLHCWRGGMRSEVMAEVFCKAGYDVELLKGGYKAYRKFIREGLARSGRIIVLGGFTGSGKTALLQAIASKGEQVVDLEKLACHKGSVFGALGQPAQPENEQFENNLYARWTELDTSRPVWLEDESRMIGRVTLPDPVIVHISSGILIRIEVDLSIRINRLVREYAGYDKKLLADAIIRIGERLGGARTKEATMALKNNQFETVAAIVLAYYDKAYLFSIERRKSENVHKIRISGEHMETDAAQIIDFAYKCLKYGTHIS
jgi:tRNA 2-selenouridine synthase